MTILFDTLKLSKSLGKAFTPEQAEVLTEALSQNIADNLATKQDLADLKVDLVKWIVGAIAFNLLATTGLILTLVKLVPR